MQKQLSRNRGKKREKHFRDRYWDPWLIAPEIKGWWLQSSSDWWWQRYPLVHNYYNQYVCRLVHPQPTCAHTQPKSTGFDCGEIWAVISSAMTIYACKESPSGFDLWAYIMIHASYIEHYRNENWVLIQFNKKHNMNTLDARHFKWTSGSRWMV